VSRWAHGIDCVCKAPVGGDTPRSRGEDSVATCRGLRGENQIAIHGFTPVASRLPLLRS
jgi:hypothetical protein